MQALCCALHASALQDQLALDARKHLQYLVTMLALFIRYHLCTDVTACVLEVTMYEAGLWVALQGGHQHLPHFREQEVQAGRGRVRRGVQGSHERCR